ncbi:MAG: complex I subunit 5 family protein [Lachnospiraceae bacterium]|nr:complex I subunit 5 family protein [Lachnospiraceae bacterium]
MKGQIILLLLTCIPMLAAFACLLLSRIGDRARDYFAQALVLIWLAVIAVLFAGALGGAEYSFTLSSFCGMPLNLRFGGFRALYTLVTAVMWGGTTILSREYLHHYNDKHRYYFFWLLTYGATLGVFMSADLFTTFIFFEIMSLASYVLVVHDEKPEAMKNGGTYLAVGVTGGMVMLMGLFLLWHELGTLDMAGLLGALEQASDSRMIWAASLCLLFGFGAKAGMFPLHFWLPKTHPVAPAPASALLSGILTKCGIFGILVTTVYIMEGSESWGVMILVLGAITMFLGAFLALFGIDLKRILACSSLSQIGFILTGTGMISLLGEENALAVRGTILHMVNHSMFKLILFMIAGVVYMNLHKLNLNEIRGFGRGKWMLRICFLMGMLGIAGIPGWSGYISKTLLHEAIVEFAHVEHAAASLKQLVAVIEWVFLISGGFTLGYMLKLYVCLFHEKNVKDQAKMAASDHSYMNRASAAAIAVPAVLVPVLGLLPHQTMDRLAALGSDFLRGAHLEHTIHYFSLTNLKGSAISIAIGLFTYFVIIRGGLMAKEGEARVYVDRWPAWLDVENLLYRPVMMTILPFIGALASRICDKITDTILYILKMTAFKEASHKRYYTLFGYMRKPTHEEAIHQELMESFSFGLLMFALGLGAVLIYLLLI